MYILLLSSLLGGAFTFILFKAALKYLNNKRKKIELLLIKQLREKFINKPAVQDFLDKLPWDRELSPLLDVHLSNLVETFKNKNPMIGIFLTEEISDPMVKSGKEEILSMVPSLKQKILNQIEGPLLYNWLLNRLSLYHFSKKILRTIGFFVFLFGAFFGFLLGTLLLIFLHIQG